MRSSPTIVRAARALLVLLATACGTVPSEPSKGVQPLLTALPRPLTAGEQGIVAAANDFSFSLFRTINAAQRDSSVFVSPLSASYALGMAMNGAEGPTYEQMRTALAFGTLPEAEINAGYKGLTTLLRELDPQVDLRIANSVWHDGGFRIEAGFADRSRTFFDARVEALDFRAPGSVTRINDWVSTSTSGRIPTIVESLGSDLVALLINAIYFKGSWREAFDPARTIAAQFRGVAGAQAAKLMHREGAMAYVANADFEAVDLPYGNGAWNMTVLLPREGRSVEQVAGTLDAARWSSTTSQLRTAEVDLYLPRFTMEWKRKLNADLENLGMVDAFVEGRADFYRLSAGSGAFISFVLQKTYVEVNEEGTEAAAVTAVGVSVTSAPQRVTMRVDRPFLFVIRERLSGTVLFMGKVVKI